MPNNVSNIAYTNPSSGISYTNKDFNSIYSEELDTVKDLTKKWDPTISNESDPGVVLLKENAIVADKENYNIDKNVLEVLPLSVSQYGNARQLYDSLGYEMKWYRSATVDSTDYNISYSYKGDKTLSGDTGGIVINVPMFTMVSDSTGEYVYTLINPPAMDGSSKSYSSSAIQGVIDDLVIGGSNVITLSNLDADMRVYLSERMVAENGIFISNDGENNWSVWQRVSNIEGSYQNVRTIYSFGVLPNSNTCYIQFAQDIADVIGNGLNIKYVKSLGESGNIPANTIESFYSDSLKFSGGGAGIDGEQVPAEDLVVTNVYSIDNGADPEDLRSAYRNYKKTVGTFDTLVTCRDYENAIYDRVNANTRQPIASNVVVSDRTNDINYSHKVITLTETGSERELAVSKDGSNNPIMTAFDLGLYVLEPMASTYTAGNYAQSFSPNKNYAGIKTAIENEKSAQHDYVDTQIHKPFMIKNFYDLNGKVVTYYKVTEEDAKDIEKKIRTKLYEKFNAREVDIGLPVDYDYLIETIKSADSRIKSVILNEPSYEPYIMYGDDTEGTYTSENTKILSPISGTINESKDILANLIANGNVQLYKFDPDFQFSFGESISGIYKNISKITTTARITVPTSDPSPSPNIGKNESVIITSPSLVTKTTYTYYTKYIYTGVTMEAKKVHTLTNGEHLVMKWVQDGEEQSWTYDEGTIVKPSIEITQNSTAIALGQTESIDIMEINTTTFSTAEGTAGENLLCYWITNNRDNILFYANEQAKILSENEYFIYTDAQRSGIVVLGSGTKLERTQTDEIKVEKVEITANNLSEKAKEIEWYTGFTYLKITEQDMIVLGEGASVWTDVALGSNLSNSYTSVPLSTKISYKDSPSSTQVDLVADSETLQYSIRSRLDISSAPGDPQVLSDKDDFTITTISGTTETTHPAINDCKVEFNYPLSMEGGNNVDMSTIDSAGNVDYKIALLAYTGANTSGIGEYITVTPTSDPSSSATKTLEISGLGNATHGGVAYTHYVIPIIVTGNLSKISSISGLATIKLGINYIQLTSVSSSITTNIVFTDNTSTDVSVLVGRVNPYDGYYLNDYLTSLGVADVASYMNDVGGVVTKINAFASYNPNAVYDISYRVPEDNRIEEPFSADAFWDVDSPYNRFTIPQMRNCNVSVIKSSKL